MARFAVAGWLDRGSPRTGRTAAPYASLALAPCLPDSIDVCLAVWEQFWCDRAGLFCGSLAFHRVRRRLVRRGPSRGKTYAYPEGHPVLMDRMRESLRARALKASVLWLRSSGERGSGAACLVKSGRDHKWDSSRD